LFLGFERKKNLRGENGEKKKKVRGEGESGGGGGGGVKGVNEREFFPKKTQ